MKTYGDKHAKDRDVTFTLKDAPNWRFEAKASLKSRIGGRKVAKPLLRHLGKHTSWMPSTLMKCRYTVPQWVDHRKLYAEDSDEATEKFHRMAVEQHTTDSIFVDQPREIRKRVGLEQRSGDRCEERYPHVVTDLEFVKKAMEAPADRAGMLCINMKQ